MIKKLHTIHSALVLIMVAVFLFVYAIHPATAASALQISNVTVSFKERLVLVEWDTNLPSDSRIDFGFDQSYGVYFVSSGALTTDHSMSLAGLDSEKTYHFAVTSKTATGESLTTFDRTFKTIKFVDQGTPEISNVHVVYVTGTTATIQWETNEDASSQVKYGLTSQYGKSAGSGTRTKLHDITLKGLKVGTAYHMQVSSKDKDGNSAVYSDQQFATLLNGEADKVPLTISDVTPITPNDPTLTTDSAVISWRTNKLATGSVSYGINKTSTGVNITGLRDFSHRLALTGLKPGTTYNFIVASTDVFGKKLKTDTMSFRTKDAQKISYATPVPSDRPVILGFSTLAYTRPTALYRLQGTPHIYAIFKDQKYHIPNVASLRLYAAYGLAIKNVPADTLNALPPVQLVKSQNSTTVYHLYRRGTDRFLKLAIPSPSVFMSYPNNKWSALVTIDDDDLGAIQNAALIKTAFSPDIYLLENSKKRRVASESAFSKRGFKYSDVVEVSQAHMDSYPTGQTLE